VKLHGQRVELGEIEAVLKTFEGVGEAVVIVTGSKTPGTEATVVAYVWPATVDVEALATWSSEKLPTHMVPAVYQVIEQWPRNSNGKIDRQALQANKQAADGHVKVSAVVQRDSLGMAKMQASLVDDRERSILSILRLLFTMGVLQHHFLPGLEISAFPCGSPWGTIAALSDIHHSADQTLLLLWLVGHSDAWAWNSFVFSFRDGMVVVLTCLDGLLDISAGCCWWLRVFMVLRIVTIASGKLRSVRVLGYAISVCAVHFQCIISQRSGDACALAWFGFEATKTTPPLAFALMYWAGLECGPFVRRFGAACEWGGICRPYTLWGIAAVSMYVLAHLIHQQTNTPAVNGCLCGDQSLGLLGFIVIKHVAIIAATAVLVAVCSPIGWHAPNVLWALLLSFGCFGQLDIRPRQDIAFPDTCLNFCKLMAIYWVLPAAFIFVLSTAFDIIIDGVTRLVNRVQIRLYSGTSSKK
jgi:hypothetical protein